MKPSKGTNALVPMMACNILLYAFQDEDDWPESFVKVYVEDALGDRVWVDNEHCRSFVENIWTAFGTKTVPRTLARQQSDPAGKQTAEQAAATGTQGTGTKVFVTCWFILLSDSARSKLINRMQLLCSGLHCTRILVGH